jgi:hypothetical protein
MGCSAASRTPGGNPPVAPGHAVPSASGHEVVRSNTAAQAKRRSRQTASATNKNGPPQGPIREICTHSEAHKPLNRENTCPRWDSNCIPSPANTGKFRKRAESGPIRHQYDRVRSPKCVLCTHAILASLEHRSHQPHPRRGGLSVFCASSLPEVNSGQLQHQPPSAAADRRPVIGLLAGSARKSALPLY